MCRKDRSGGNSILGGDLWHNSHRYRLRHSLFSAASTLRALQRDPAVDSGGTSINSGLLCKTTAVYSVQRSRATGIDPILQYCDVIEGSLRTDSRGDGFIPEGDRKCLRCNQDRGGEARSCANHCLYLSSHKRKLETLKDLSFSNLTKDSKDFRESEIPIPRNFV